MPVIFDDNHYCILAINVLEVAKEVPIAYIYITKNFARDRVVSNMRQHDQYTIQS